MQIKELNTQTGWITLEMQDTELRTITNMFCKAKRDDKVGFTAKEYEIYSNLYAAISILHCGALPDFELNHIRELRDKAEELSNINWSEEKEV